MNKKSLITGITGQLGSYLAEVLIANGEEVYGLVRENSTTNKQRISHILDKIHLVKGDITDFASLCKVLRGVKPDTIYNFAAQSSVFTSVEEPLYTWDVTAKGCMNLLEAYKQLCPEAKFFHASSSEIFGENYFVYYDEMLEMRYYQTESTAQCPRNPYGVAKAAAHQLCKVYRDDYDLFITNGILYPNDSPRRHEDFFTRKVTKYLGALYREYGNSIDIFEPYKWHQKLKLGNLDVYRNFTHSAEVAGAIYLMMQLSKPNDYIVSSGVNYSLRDFLNMAFRKHNLDYKDFVVIDQAFYRKSSKLNIVGNNSRLTRDTGWKPELDLEYIITSMLNYDCYGVLDVPQRLE